MNTSSDNVKQEPFACFASRKSTTLMKRPFQPPAFKCTLSPFFSFRLIDQESLIAALERADTYGGLILTSPRAVQALAESLKWLPGNVVLWHTKPVFAVGMRTASDLRLIGFRPEGEESGTGAQLGRYIIRQEIDRPLLFLCGNLRREELPDKLRAAGVPFEELCVYETLPVATIDLSGHSLPDWVVFFSPSGVEAVRQKHIIDWHSVRLAAIGQTTAEAIRQDGLEVEAVAAEPTPESLLQAIEATYTR